METVESLLKKAENCLVLNNAEKALEYYNLILEEDISNAEAWYGKAKIDYMPPPTQEYGLNFHYLKESFEYINTNKERLLKKYKTKNRTI